MKTDKFGLSNIYFLKNNTSDALKPLDRMNKHIINNGFKDYSAEGISSYFIFRYPVLGFTMFDDIQRLDTAIEINRDHMGAQHFFTYWHPCFSTNGITEKEAAIEAKKLLVQAIDRLVKKKQIIGIMLSGGLDSSLIAAMCRSLYPNKQIYTYSCGFYGDDEFEYSRQVAKLFSDKHSEFVLSKGDFIGPKSILPSLIKHKCAPLHPNETALAYAEIHARQDLCDIVLCGEGADDIFGGYGHNLRMFMTYFGEPIRFFDYILQNYSYFSAEDRKKLLNPKFNCDLEARINIFQEKYSPTALEDMMLYFIQRLHTRGLIERGMNALDYNSFDPGFPFIDSDLVDFVNSLHFNMKVRWKEGKAPKNINGLSYSEISENFDITKYLLKKIAEEYLPNNIIYRQKKGFPVPFQLWFENDKTWDLDERVFKTKDINWLSGWKKFMVINLNEFFRIFNKYRS